MRTPLYDGRLRLSSLWPPRHTIDRLSFELYQRRHPDAPWLPKDTIELLTSLLRSGDRCIEWGSGRSTPWLGKRVGRLVSAEHDPVWYDRVREMLAADGLDRDSVRLLSIEPKGDPSTSPYVRVIDEFPDGELDVAYVDGEHRSACALAAIPKLTAGGLLIVDDAHGVLDHASSSPHSRYRRGPLDADWERVAALLSRWRLIWISDGYSDTAIYFKP